MINGIEGIPGSGKSYEAVAFHILPALKEGRKVITNLPLEIEQIKAINPEYADLIEIRKVPQPIRGVWDADAVSRGEMAYQLCEGTIEAKDASRTVFGGVWDYYDTWRDDKGRSALFVIDECHVAMPRLGTSKEVIQWYKLSRHFGADVVLITQSFREMCPDISVLLATLVKLRKADILGKKGSYIRKVHAGYRAAEISREERPYKPEIFPFYKSHTQGNTVIEAGMQDVSPFIVKFNRIKWAVLAIGVATMVWAFWPKPGYNVFGARVADTPTPQQKAVIAEFTQPWDSHSDTKQPTGPEKPKVNEPLFEKDVHIVGVLRSKKRHRVIFAISEGGRVQFELTSDELVRAGYRLTLMGDCMAFMDYEGADRRAVTCDVPMMNQGNENRPVVFDSSTGAYSDDRHAKWKN